MTLHPVQVAPQRVDLAIMREHPEGLGQRPLREGVGRVALVINRHRGLKPLIAQVQIKIVDILSQEHALIDQ